MNGNSGVGLSSGWVSRCLAAALVLVMCGNAQAFQVLKTSRGLDIKWAGSGATFFFNAAGSPAGSLDALQAALQTWSDLPLSSFNFTYGGTTAATSFNVRDGVNNIGFGPLTDAGVIALTTYWYNASTGAMEDADLQFNTKLSWSTSGAVNAYDVQEIGTHELGHGLGLSDLYSTSDAEKTMYGYSFKGETKKRSLDQDDKNGVAYLYPGTGVVVTTGDFDGDGRFDLVDYHPASGNWYILTGAEATRAPCGFAGTTPVVGDFDADGKADKAVYYPPSGMWYFLKSTAGFAQVQFGFPGTTPVVGDFDGDGTTDLGLYHPPSGTWYFLKSTAGFAQVQFGFPGTTPVVGDFDGDGTADIGVYHPPSGNWYFLKSAAGFAQLQFGFPGTTPVVADFDGDGKDDLAVYHAASGTWYLLKSSEGFLQTTVTF
jgi:hypothetical protein